jgi:hypothetical protein
MSSSVVAARSWGVPSAATSWQIVLIAICWMPVTEYSSRAGILASTRSTAPPVRRSR